MRKFRVDALIEGVPWGLPRATTLGQSPSFCPPVNSDEHLSPSPLKCIAFSDKSETRVRLPHFARNMSLACCPAGPRHSSYRLTLSQAASTSSFALSSTPAHPDQLEAPYFFASVPHTSSRRPLSIPHRVHPSDIGSTPLMVTKAFDVLRASAARPWIFPATEVGQSRKTRLGFYRHVFL